MAFDKAAGEMITECGDTIQIKIVGVDQYGVPDAVDVQYMVTRNAEPFTANAWADLKLALLQALSSWAKTEWLETLKEEVREKLKMCMPQRWVCLDIADRVITCGITTRGKFDMRCMNLTSLGIADWIEGGQKYCEVWVAKDISYGVRIDEISHGHIRRSKVKLGGDSEEK